MKQIVDKKIAILIGVGILVLIAVVLIIGTKTGDRSGETKNEELLEGTREIDESYKVVEELMDFEKQDAYEVRVYNLDRRVEVYRNSEKQSDIGTIHTGSSEPIISFHPEESLEKLTTLEPYKVDNLDNVYSVSLEVSEKFVGNLINNEEYALIRSKKTSEYCDLYLKKRGKYEYRRIIVTSKKLVDTEFDGDIELEDIRLSLD